MSSTRGSGKFWLKRFLRRPHLGWRYHLLTVRPFKRHSLVLMVSGAAYVAIGLSYVLPELTEARKQALIVAIRWFPIEIWGTVFVVVGLSAIVSSRWPTISDSWGYAILTGLSAGWSATYAAGVILDNSPIGNLSQTLVWGLLAFLWWAISGFVNPDKTVVVVIKDDGQGSDT